MAQYAIDFNALVEALWHKPHLIGKVEGLTEDSVLEIVKAYDKAHRFHSGILKLYSYLPASLKTLKITREYLKKSPDGNYIPDEIIQKFKAPDREIVLNQCATDFILRLPNITVEDWEKALAHNFDEDRFHEIPKDIWTKGMVRAFLKKESLYFSGSLKKTHEILKPLLDPGFVLEMVTLHQEALSLIPPELITREVLKQALETCEKKGYAIDFQNLNIPEEVWTTELAWQVIKGNAANVMYIPAKVLTTEVMIEVALYGEDLKTVAYKDYQIALAAVIGSSLYDGKIVRAIKRTLKGRTPGSILLDAIMFCKARDDHNPHFILSNLRRLGFSVANIAMIEAIKYNPEIYRGIEKSEQTDEMFETLVSVASCDLIDELAGAGTIDLRRIKAKVAPLLVNCKNKAIGRVVARVFQGRKRTARAKVNFDLNAVPKGNLVLNLTEAEWLKIKK